MTNKYTLFRTWKTTVYKLKILAAYKGESMVSTIDRLVTDEIFRLGISLPEQEKEQDQDD